MTAVQQRRILRWAVALVALVVVTWIAVRIPKTITIFLVAAFIAFGANPIVVRLERRMKRPFAIAIVYLFLLLALVVLGVLVLPATIEQIRVLSTNAPAYLNSSQDYLLKMETGIRHRFGNGVLPANLGDVHQITGTKVTAFLTAAVTSLGAILVQTFTAVFIGVSALVLSFFFLLRREEIAETFAGIFPPHNRESARHLAVEIAQIFGSFISGQIIVSAITGVLIGVILEAIGFKYALIVAIICGLAYAIPILGMLVAQVIAALIAAPQGWLMVLLVTIVIFIVARISDNILVPKIMGESVGVSPIAVMFAVFAGGELFGIAGLILAIPAAALIKVLWRAFVAPLLFKMELEPAPELHTLGSGHPE